MAGTPVVAAAGLVPVEDVRAGDLVLATDVDGGGGTTVKPVARTYVRASDTLVHLTIGGRVTSVTPEHLFHVPGAGWVKAAGLTPATRLLGPGGEPVMVDDVRIELFDTPVTVFNFEVEEYHTYYAGHTPVLVHNANYARSATDAGDDWR